MPESAEVQWERVRWDGVAIRFGEIALKGGNRRPFVLQLRQNLARVLAPLGARVRAGFDHLFAEVDAAAIGEAVQRAAKVFGVSHAAPVRRVKPDPECIRDEAIALYRAVAPPGASFAVRARRSDKSFPLSSQDLERQVGADVKAATGAPVDLTCPDVLLQFRIYPGIALAEGPRANGPGGLPIGVSGRVLALFSGGIDSPVAAWLVMKRGCVTDFLHFYAGPNSEEWRRSKIGALLKALLEPQGIQARLFQVPYSVFESRLLAAQVPHGLELILFRRFMARVAAALAQREGHEALVTGDNLSQVASQTMANLRAFDEAAGCTLFRPLLGFNKDEIVALARRIGTYELSILAYKDCCSLIARHPHTHPRPELVHAAEAQLPLAEMTQEALAHLSAWDVPS